MKKAERIIIALIKAFSLSAGDEEEGGMRRFDERIFLSLPTFYRSELAGKKNPKCMVAKRRMDFFSQSSLVCTCNSKSIEKQSGEKWHAFAFSKLIRKQELSAMTSQ